MKKILSAASVLLFTANTNSTAQTITDAAITISGGTKCAIFYEYTKSGDRVKRYYSCKSDMPPANPVTLTGSFSKVYPNPTSDKFNVEFSQPMPYGYITVSDMTGTYISGIQFSQLLQIVQLDISQQVPGIYIVRVQSGNQVDCFQLTKL